MTTANPMTLTFIQGHKSSASQTWLLLNCITSDYLSYYIQTWHDSMDAPHVHARFDYLDLDARSQWVGKGNTIGVPCSRQRSRQICINLAITVGLFFTWPWPWLCKRLYGLSSLLFTLKRLTWTRPCLRVRACLCLSFASDFSETIEVIIIKPGTVIASDVGKHHVFTIWAVTFSQGQTDLNHETKIRLFHTLFKQCSSCLLGR